MTSLPEPNDELPGDGDVASFVESDESDESDAVEPAEEPPEDAPAPDDELDELEFSEPVEPLDPVVSANATAGIDAIAAPTPKATASPATRPT